MQARTDHAQPPYSLTYSASSARTKARARKLDASGKEVYAAAKARALSEVEWRCVLLTWAVTGWPCRCIEGRLARFPCNCRPSWTCDEARCACLPSHVEAVS